MNPIQVLCAENQLCAGEHRPQQRLWFCCAVQHRAFEKHVEIHWSIGHGSWQVQPAHFVRTGPEFEVWEAEVRCDADVDGNGASRTVNFAVRFHTADGEWWDNNVGHNHHVDLDTAFVVPERAVMTLAPEPVLATGATRYRLRVVVHPSLAARSVHVRWTTDRWRNHLDTPAWPEPHLPALHRKSKEAGAPGAIWTTEIPIEDATAVEFAVFAETAAGAQVWDNNFGHNYVAHRARLKVLTLNLHCFEEEDWDEKFWRIARAIDDHHVDIVCFQEVAEPWNDGNGDRRHNAAYIIRERLRSRYSLTTDWSHLGFGRYREGSAILSRYHVTLKDSAYVSVSTDPYDIHARKVVMAQVLVPGIGAINVFSSHLSWWSDGFEAQFNALRRWADGEHHPRVAATLLCGDFNSAPSSDGYQLATKGGEYEDQYLKAHLKAGLNGDVAAGTDGRIDYIFLKRGSLLEAVHCKPLFTPADYGRVSDHPGYYAEFELSR